MDGENLRQGIFRVAFDIYERSGRIEGRDLDHWLEAERIVRTLREIAGNNDKKLISVNVPKARSDEEGGWMIKFFKR